MMWLKPYSHNNKNESRASMGSREHPGGRGDPGDGGPNGGRAADGLLCHSTTRARPRPERDNTAGDSLAKPCKHGSGAPARSKCSTGTQTDELQGTPETGQLNTLGLQGTDVSDEPTTKWVRMIHVEGDTAEDPGDNGEGRQDRLDSSLESDTEGRTEPAAQMPIPPTAAQARAWEENTGLQTLFLQMTNMLDSFRQEMRTT